MNKLIFIITLPALLLCLPLQAEEDLRRKVTVSGEGEISVAPDMALITMSAESRQSDLKSAQSEVSSITNRFLNLAGSLEIPRKQITTAQLSISPQYRWDKEKNRQFLTGYHVSRQLRVDLRDLDKLGRLMEGAVEAGINQVSGTRMDHSKRQELQRDALKLAAEDARNNAQVLVRAMGAGLGDVLEIQSSNNQYQPPVYRTRDMAAQSESFDPAQSYEVGEIEIKTRIMAVFEIR